MVDVAVIGLGAWGLCFLERTVSQARRCKRPVRIHVIEPGAIGGVAYDVRQPDYLVLNNACGQLSLYACPEEDPADRPGYGMSLFEWANWCGYRWVGDQCVINGDGRAISPGDYLPRRLMGEYLGWFYEALLRELPGNVEVVRYRSWAVDIRGGRQERVLLADGREVVADHVVLTSGHTPNRGVEPQPGEVTQRSAYPIASLQDSVRPGDRVAVSGMGLVAYDILATLTTGRGGRFQDVGERKVYLPSGREPVIVLYSRSGVPYCAKSVTGIDPTGDYRPVVCTPDAFAAIRGVARARHGRIDLRAELLPLLFREMQSRYYVQAATNANGAATAARIRSRLRGAWLGGGFDDTVAHLAKRYGTFRPEEQLFAGLGREYASAADYEKQFYAMVQEDLHDALDPAGSPVKAAQEVLRILRDDIRSVVEFGGLTLESYLDFKRNFKGRVNRLEAGPPVLRSQQLLALMDAGVVTVPFGPAPTLSVGDDGRPVLSSTTLDIPHSESVDMVVRGHLDMPALAQSASPLLSRLYESGRLTELRYGDAAVGSVALSEDSHPIDRDGRSQPGLSLFGVLTEGSRYFTHYLPSPRSRLRAVLDAQACADAVLAAA